MHSWVRFLLVSASLRALCVACLAQGQSGDTVFLAVWQLHLGGTGDHARVAAACDEFEKRTPDDPLVTATRGLAAWHLLHAGNTNAAVRLFESMLRAPSGSTRESALREAGANMARAWLTRIDRDRVRSALRARYLKDISYPESLEAFAALPVDQRPPPVDRWGTPWSYRRAAFKYLRGPEGQRYTLQSVRLGRQSDLAETLALPYGGALALKPVKVISPVRGEARVEFQPVAADSAGGEMKAIRLTEGEKAGSICFAYMGSSLVLLADLNHWGAFSRP